MKLLKGWKTLIAGLVLLLVSLADLLDQIDLNSLFKIFLPEAKAGTAVAVVSLLFLVLRIYTTTAVGEKDDQ